MTKIILSDDAKLDLLRIRNFLKDLDADAAKNAGKTIALSINQLAKYPELVPIVDQECRILTVPFGKRGYSVAYVYETASDTVIVLGVKHQREEFFPFELEQLAEASEDNSEE